MNKDIKMVEKNTDDTERMERMRTADSALRMALNPKRNGNGVKYPHNFAFQAMQKVHAKELERKRRSRITEIIVMSLSAIASLVALAYLIDWGALAKSLLPAKDFNTSSLIPEIPQFQPGMVCTLAFCFVFFIGLNTLLKKIFKE